VIDARIKKILRPVRHALLMSVVWIWRRLMFRTTFIAITGSLGKTSCKDAVATVLRARFRLVSSRGNSNHFGGVTKTVLRVRPWHRYAVIEVGIVKPGQMVKFARALKPDIAVWVSVANTHRMYFRSLETTAHEKSRLVEGVRAGGMAILNDDNTYIASYQPPQSIRSIRYGRTERSQYRVLEAGGRWPERLSFVVTTDGEVSPRMETRFVGTHWTGSLVPAVVIGREAGMSFTEVAGALASCEPMKRRMSPVELPNGVTILRDEVNGSVDTLEAALKVLEQATAQRKMIVFTDVSDSSQKPRNRVRDVGKTVAGFAQSAMFLGEYSEYGARAAVASGMPSDQVWHFLNIEDGARQLKESLRPGDLVLLRGRRVDHLARVYHALIGDVTCWRNRCDLRIDCGDCPRLNAKTPRRAGRRGVLAVLRS
jgi:UDP-N-acetylmuramoyl-tripeptide--D-alanyl-D-alanine ligase